MISWRLFHWQNMTWNFPLFMIPSYCVHKLYQSWRKSAIYKVQSWIIDIYKYVQSWADTNVHNPFRSKLKSLKYYSQSLVENKRRRRYRVDIWTVSNLSFWIESDACKWCWPCQDGAWVQPISVVPHPFIVLHVSLFAYI